MGRRLRRQSLEEEGFTRVRDGPRGTGGCSGRTDPMERPPRRPEGGCRVRSRVGDPCERRGHRWGQEELAARRALPFSGARRCERGRPLGHDLPTPTVAATRRWRRTPHDAHCSWGRSDHSCPHSRHRRCTFGSTDPEVNVLAPRTISLGVSSTPQTGHLGLSLASSIRPTSQWSYPMPCPACFDGRSQYFHPAGIASGRCRPGRRLPPTLDRQWRSRWP